MFSVDYPCESSAVASEFLARASLSDAVRAKIAGANVARWLRRPLPAETPWR
jgi:predicted TIM-barrel fold metal-dependent hydrolase